MLLRCNRTGLLVLLVALAPLALACQGPRAASMHHGGHAATYSDDREIVEVVSTLMGGKNVFVPSTVVLTAGEGRALSLFNTTDIPHGFTIPALGVEAVLPSREEYVIELPELQPGVYAIRCHLHPPHRSATLLVLP